MKSAQSDPAAKRSKRLFISYARLDADTAREIALQLETVGYEVWWDVRLVAGSTYRRDLATYIDSASKVLVIWSPNSVASNFVIDEATLALEQGKLVPISIQNTKPPLGFGQLHTLAIGRVKSSIDQIVAAIEGNPAISRRVRFSPAPKRLRRLAVIAGLVLLAVGGGLLLLNRHSMDHLVNCVRYGCELNYVTYRSNSMGLEFVYPQNHLALVTVQERERILPLLNSKGETEVTIFRSALPGSKTPMQASSDEQKKLTENGDMITYVAPQMDPETKPFYVIAGRKADGKTFYFRRWFTLRDMVSAEYMYATDLKPLYDRVIVDMTIRSMKISDLK
jgi:TIR domain